MRPVTFLVVDDHELVRDGIKSWLEKQAGWKVCAVAANGRESVELADRLRPDVVVMDVGMPELNGLEAARQILKLRPESKVLILTMQTSDDLVREALKAGVRGFLLKTDAARLLPAAVEALLAGKTFFTANVSSLLLEDFLQPKLAAENLGAAAGRLTTREREIVQLLAEGKTSKEIATRLGVSARTISAHRANLMRKLHLHAIADLVRYAVHNRIVEL